MNFSNLSLSHELKFITNCCSVSLFHGVQSFRNRLLQRGSTTGSHVLPANLLQHGLLSPQVLAVTCSKTGSPWGHSLLQASTCSGVRSFTGCRWMSAALWTSMGCRRTACLTMVFTMGCRRSSALAPGAPPPPPSSLTLVSAELFLSYILTLLSLLQLCSSFFLILNMLSQRRYHHR